MRRPAKFYAASVRWVAAEFAQVDGKGHVYVNIEGQDEVIEINAKDATVAKRYSIAPSRWPKRGLRST